MRSLVVVSRVADIDGLKSPTKRRKAKILLQDATKSLCSKCRESVYIAKATSDANVLLNVDDVVLLCTVCAYD